ncbi:MAG: alpha/beta hydrolase [Isosphaeraceae bacterium]
MLFLTGWLAASCPLVARAQGAAETLKPSETLDVWPGEVPGETRPVGAEKLVPAKKDARCQEMLTNVSKPSIAVYRPTKAKDTGAAVIVSPGGGYAILAMDLEGREVAEWLNSIGVTAIVLKYRVPRRPDTSKVDPPLVALMDAQRAVSLVRSKAKAWGIDPNRIGVLGFSAGGHLTAWTATNGDRRAYEESDAVDRVSCRPDFAILIYPAYLQSKEDPDKLAPEIRVSSSTPPCFFAHAHNDPINPEGSAVMYLAMKRANVPAELHIYKSGGHGFGLRPEGTPCSTWPARCAEWLKDRGIIKAG